MIFNKKYKHKALTYVALLFLTLISCLQTMSYCLFNRKIGGANSIVPYLTQGEDLETNWKRVMVALDADSNGLEYQISHRDLERVKELIFYANHYSPDEHEGGGRVSARLRSIIFLTELYPEINNQVDKNSNTVRVSDIYKIIRDRQPSPSRIIFLSCGLIARMHNKPCE